MNICCVKPTIGLTAEVYVSSWQLLTKM